MPLPVPMLEGSALPRLAIAAVLSLTLGGAAPARAQDEPAGALGLHFLASPQQDFGAMIGADLYYPIDWFRVGGFLGVGAIPSEEDVRNRVFMPLGASVAIEVMGADVGFSLRARGGLWAGATQEVKITAGGLVGGGAHLLVHLGGGTTLSVGLDVYGLFGDGETAVFAPGIGLTWNPAAAVDEGPETP